MISHLLRMGVGVRVHMDSHDTMMMSSAQLCTVI